MTRVSIWWCSDNTIVDNAVLHANQFVYTENADEHLFRPHVTLLSLEPENLNAVIEKFKQIPLQAIDLSLGTYYFDPYNSNPFQCVMVLPKPLSEQFHSFRSSLLSHFTQKPSSFFPHVSMVYGDLSTVKRTELKKHLEKSHSLSNERFDLSHLLLVDTTGPHQSSWTVLCSLSVDGSILN